MMNMISQIVLTVSRWFELSLLAKGTVLLAVGLVAVFATRRSRASVRHLILAATFVGIGVLPVILIAEPVIPINIVSPNGYAPASSALAAPNLAASSPTDASGAPVAERGSRPPAGKRPLGIIHLIWICGALVFMAPPAISAWRVRRYRRGALPWLERQDGMRARAAELGIHIPVEVLLHEQIAAPLTCGVLNPAVLFPADAPERGEADLRRSFVHELEHVRRRDWITQAAARTICALYWFHPLAWIAWRRLCLEAERACDDAAIGNEQPAERAEYAAQLVSLARRMSADTAHGVVGMANRSDLSKRVLALLDGTQRRGRAGLAAMAMILIGAAVLTFGVAPLHVVAQTPAPSGSELTGLEPAGSEPRGSELTGELPLYAGAKPKPEEPGIKPHRGSLDLHHMEVAGASAAKYQVDAAAPDVVAFYRRSLQQLGSVTECTGGENRLVSVRIDPEFLQNPGLCRPMEFGEGETELKTGADGEYWIVTVQPTAGFSEFTLVHVRNAKPAVVRDGQ